MEYQGTFGALCLCLWCSRADMSGPLGILYAHALESVGESYQIVNNEIALKRDLKILPALLIFIFLKLHRFKVRIDRLLKSLIMDSRHLILHHKIVLFANRAPMSRMRDSISPKDHHMLRASPSKI